MKFTFKIQKYQTQAVDALVKCFEGQQFADKVQYLRDKGMSRGLDFANAKYEENFLFDETTIVGSNEPVARSARKLYDSSLSRLANPCDDYELSDDGYRNADLVLSEKELLDNIHKVQNDNFIIRSPQIEHTAGRPSFDIEMETGTGKTQRPCTS